MTHFTRTRRSKAGRPPFPDGEARDKVITVRVTADEREWFKRVALGQRTTVSVLVLSAVNQAFPREHFP